MEHHTETSGHLERHLERNRETEIEVERHIGKQGNRDRKRLGKGSRLYNRGSPNSQMKANGCAQLSEAAHLAEGSLLM